MDTPVTFVIFGASGDLAHRKLIPALFNLWRKQRLPKPFQVLGFAVNPWSNEEFRESLRKGLGDFASYEFSEAEWQQFAACLHYLSGNFSAPADFATLAKQLQTIEEATAAGRIYYMATPPQFFPIIAAELGHAGLLDQAAGWRRLVVEKPFGTNFETARALNQALHTVLDEEQIYRIDHYLGKETVQNLLIFRFANTLFEPVWNRQYIDHVQISVVEQVDVGHRGGYYDQAGVLRDMFQNHLFQLLALTAIEPPDTFQHEDLHRRKLEALQAVRPMTAEQVAQNSVRGQYRGYRQAEGVDPQSQTATYAALRLFIDTPRWQDVPFYLRSGKSLSHKCSEIIIQFTCPNTAVPPLPPGEKITANVLAICIQPNEGIFLRFEAKVPDTEADVKSVEMEFHYAEAFGEQAIPEAYERLILEVIQGDHTLFVRNEVVEQGWRIIDPILRAWEVAQTEPLETYEPGSWGPEAAERLIAENGWRWLVTCGSH